jgi:hypothetical protein
MSLQKHTKECGNELASNNGDLNDVDMLREDNDSIWDTLGKCRDSFQRKPGNPQLIPATRSGISENERPFVEGMMGGIANCC